MTTAVKVTRVIKIGGRVQRDARLAGVLARLWAQAPRSFCVVHGGGETISTLQTQLGRAPVFVDGRRVTTEGDIEVLRMALSGVANKILVDSLRTKGTAAVGISGEDGSLIVARALNAAVLGCVGVPVDVNDGVVRTLLAGGFLPVISPVARNGEEEKGGALNVNADDAAAAIAASLDAEELLLISDVTGVIIDGVAASALSAEEAMHAIESGIATEGMVTKLRAALDALERGVPQVRIGGLDALLDASLGTALLATPQLA
ncbi:MAG: acetylglutamate kinase [Gemmatimonadaceae bacterium]|nr:acetylglutamate kinase [Gemmatimonadaceae bacterium]